MEMYTGDGEARQISRIFREMIERVADFLVVELRPIFHFGLKIVRIQHVY